MPTGGSRVRQSEESESADITWPTIDGMDLGEEEFDLGANTGEVGIELTSARTILTPIDALAYRLPICLNWISIVASAGRLSAISSQFWSDLA